MQQKIYFETRTFTDFSLLELYEILSLRSDTFVLEQRSLYRDIDHKDPLALHLLGFVNDTIIAYARLFRAGDYYENASIGRIVVREGYRDNGAGKELLQRAITLIEETFREPRITVGAQMHLKRFYEKFGFQEQSAPYDEDGIMHILMTKEL